MTLTTYKKSYPTADGWQHAKFRLKKADPVKRETFLKLFLTTPHCYEVPVFDQQGEHLTVIYRRIETVRGLPVISMQEAMDRNYASISTPIDPKTEPALLASFAQHRDPSRAAWVEVIGGYELYVLRHDLKPVDPE